MQCWVSAHAVSQQRGSSLARGPDDRLGGGVGRARLVAAARFEGMAAAVFESWGRASCALPRKRVSERTEGELWRGCRDGSGPAAIRLRWGGGSKGAMRCDAQKR